MKPARLLYVEDLKTYFFTDRGVIKAVDGVSFHVNRGEIVGIIGESGCGKTVTMLSIMRLIPEPPGKIVSGKIFFEGVDLLSYGPKDKEMCKIRGSKISVIFQEPMTSLNPVLSIGMQLGEMFEIHTNVTAKEAKKRALELLETVKVPAPRARLKQYPHQLSGGLRQRVMIAMAISCRPSLIIADEPTTALDVTTQAALLELLVSLVRTFNISLLIITHNLGIVARYADRIYVMYAGRIVESGTTDEIFYSAAHPYTLGLLNCVPRLGSNRKLVPIEGFPPDLIDMPPQCAFLPRCKAKKNICEKEPWPPLTSISETHSVACWNRQ